MGLLRCCLPRYETGGLYGKMAGFNHHAGRSDDTAYWSHRSVLAIARSHFILIFLHQHYISLIFTLPLLTILQAIP